MSIRTVLGARVLVKRERSEATSHGLHVPETARHKKPSEGIAVQVSPEVETVKPGDRVFFKQYAGLPIDIEGEPHLFIDEDDLEAVAEA